MNPIGLLHGRLVHSRRVRVLCRELAELIPAGARVLDVGCGDTLLAHLVTQQRPDITVEGIDLLVREQALVPVTRFDGQVIPFADKSFDAVTFVDVLHHLENPTVLLREAVRVSRQVLVIKDHTLDGIGAGRTLRFMDWIGNAPHGMVLPYNYWCRATWLWEFAALGLTVRIWKADVKLYPWPANWVFGRSLHFIAQLGVP